MKARKQILNMLSEGTITVDEALELLDALSTAGSEGGEKKEKARGRIKKIRINFEKLRKDGKPPKTDAVEIPLSLAKFVGKFVGKDNMIDLEGEGINLNEIFEALKEDDLERGVLLDMEAERKRGRGKARIKVEVI